jgi:predicted permease
MSWRTQARERMVALINRGRVDAETAEEMQHHIEMEATRIAGETGVSLAEARRRAAILFGGVDKHQEAVRDARGFGFLNGTSLDVKLGVRMLAKYPGLTAAGVLALAVAVAMAASWFDFLQDMTYPHIGLSEANRIVVVQRFDRKAAEPEPKGLHDFAIWRKSKTIDGLSVVERRDLAVVTDDRRLGTMRAARATPGALDVARVHPLLGRLLVHGDEREGTPLAVVLAYDAWQKLYDGDRNVLGRGLRVGDTPGTIVGVMPEGFAFPVNQQLWIPLRDRPESFEAGTGPSVMMFGRLRPGVTVEEAQAELTAMTQGDVAVRHAASEEDVGARVKPLTDVARQNPFMELMNLPFILFLVVVCANVATLVYARTASRSGEIAVRSALGASRRRLVLQLIGEALVLTSVATALGLGAAAFGMRRVMALFWEIQQTTPPFWFDPSLSWLTVGYACVLAVFAAVIIGGIPALKATGKSLRAQFVQSGAGGAGLRFGKVSTGVIVLQVALCVAFLPFAVQQGRTLIPTAEKKAARFPAGEFLTGVVARQAVAADTKQDSVTTAQTFGARLSQVKARLMTEPGVTAVTFASRLPGFNHEVEDLQIENDTAKALDARITGVDQDFFTTMRAKIVAGRNFRPEDFTNDVSILIADAGWARETFGGRNPIGQRIRFPTRKDAEATRWYEIAGVVDGMERAVGPGSEVALYTPLSRKSGAAQIYVRTSTRPSPLAPSIAAAVSSVDPQLSLMNATSLDDVWRPVEHSDIYFLAGLNVVAFVILGFALIGIYALMSFTVAQRSREIAIRAALGATPGKILSSIFGRAMLQVGMGVVLGAAVISLATVRTTGEGALVAAVAMAMFLMGLAGCALPATRALHIQPTDAIKAE